LQRAYFEKRSIPTEVAWADNDDTDVNELYKAWQALPAERRSVIDAELRSVHDLATEDGIRLIVEEAPLQGPGLIEELSKHQGLHSKAMWTLLSHPHVYRAAYVLNSVHRTNGRFWHRRKDLPAKVPDTSDEAIAKFKAGLTKLYWEKEGRGEECAVELFSRAGRVQYFCVYPKDHSQTFVGFQAGRRGLVREPVQPAFEIVFAFDPDSGCLDTCMRGDKRRREAVQKIFADAILRHDLGPETKRSDAYELSLLRNPEFVFAAVPHLGLKGMRLRKLTFVERGNWSSRFGVEADSSGNATAVHSFLKSLLDPKSNILARFDVDRATVVADFVPNSDGSETIQFELSAKGLRLEDTPQSQAIMESLRLSGVSNVAATPEPARAA
jgi:hypothetical protein